MSYKFAIVGSGPAGFFAAKSLVKLLPNCRVDIFEKLPVPFGLIRFGVAPDHQDMKNVTNDFTELAQTPNCNFYGNVDIGKDISYQALKEAYSGVVYAFGASSSDKKLNIPGGELTYSARDFVEWYNGMPGSASFSLKGVNKVGIVGNGNVAVDVARILAQPLEVLAKTDISQQAFNELKDSEIREVEMIGRRGALQAAMTAKELRLLTKVEGLSFKVYEDEIQDSKNQASVEEGELNIIGATKLQTRARRRLFDLIDSLPRESTPGSRVQLTLRFLHSPISYKSPILTMERNTLCGPPFKQTCQGTGEFSTTQCDMLFRSIGYKGNSIDKDLPFDEELGVVKNTGGRVEEGVYVTGWAKTGPFGIIDTTMRNVFLTVDTLMSDMKEGKITQKRSIETEELLQGKQYVSFSDWEKINAYEKAEGSKTGKVREKVTDLNKMLEIAFS